MEEFIYFKCTACSECFMAEEVFFAHTRTWHCKILVCAGQDPDFGIVAGHLDDSSVFVKREVEDTSRQADINLQNDSIASANSSRKASDGADLFATFDSVMTPEQISKTANLCGDIEEIDLEKYFPAYSEQAPSAVKSEFEMNSIATSQLSTSVHNWNSPENLVSYSSNYAKPLHSDFVAQNKRFTAASVSHKPGKVKKAPVRKNLTNTKKPTVMVTKGDSNSMMQSITVPSKTQWQCKMCTYKTFLKGDMTKHLRKHTGEKPFQCSYCGNRFTTQSNLMQHQRTVHKAIANSSTFVT